MMTRALVLSLLVLVPSCKKDEKAADKPAAEPAAAVPTTPTPTTPDPVAPPAPAPVTATGELAAITIPFAKTQMDKVLTGGQPTEENLQQAKDKGIKTIVNLRSAAEEKDFATEAKKVEELGMKYVHIPIDGKTGEGLNEENAKKLAALMADDQKPMIVHCATGQRVGALLALKAFYVDGTPAEGALQAGKDNGLSKPELEKIVADHIAANAKTKTM